MSRNAWIAVIVAGVAVAGLVVVGVGGGAVLWLMKGSAAPGGGPTVQSAVQPAPADRPAVDLADFIDHTEKYRGQTLTLQLTVGESIHAADGSSLRDFVGRDAKFYAFGAKSERLDMLISIPPGLTVPAARLADRLIVTFECAEGELRRGNVAKSIERP